jgi:hypothetical protein
MLELGGRRPFYVILGLSGLLFALHLWIASVQANYAYVDDITYLSASIDILDKTRCALVAGNGCNYEHPPLTKVIMAVGFLIFGRVATFGTQAGVGANQFAGRLFQMLMDALSAPLMYLIVNKMSDGNWKMSLVAAAFILVDPLYFTLSSTAILDTPMVFFGILALLPYAYGEKVGRFNGYLLTGAVLGLSLLSKESAAFIIVAILTFELLFADGAWRKRLLSCVWIVVGIVIVFCVGLEVYDVTLTNFPSFASQIEMMVGFHFGAGPGQITYLAEAGNCNLFTALCPTDRSLIPHFLYGDLPLGPIISNNCFECWAAQNPLDWLTYFPPVVLPQALVTAPNYALVWLSFAWVPLAAWKFRAIRATQEGKVLLMGLSIFSWNVFSNVFIYSVVDRPVFEWYFLPAVPGLAMGGAYLLTRPGIPRWARYGLIAAVIFVGVLLSPALYELLYPQPQTCVWC